MRREDIYWIGIIFAIMLIMLSLNNLIPLSRYPILSWILLVVGILLILLRSKIVKLLVKDD